MTDFQAIYPWLKKSLFERILRRDRANDCICVTDIAVQSALADGENYTSQMLRVGVSYKDETTGVCSIEPFIVKAEQTHNGVGEIVSDMGLFAKEVQNFEVILPAVHELLRSIGDETVIAPKCYAASLEDSYLVFEDLSRKGFANKSRYSGLGVDEFRMVFSMAAKWHATTAVLFEKDPSMFEMFQDNAFCREPWPQLIHNISNAIADACQKIPRYQHVTAKIKGGLNAIFDRFIEATKTNPTSFNTLTHGDLWSNNVMFAKDETTGETNAILVDFQLNSYNSPLIDMVYALTTSSHGDVTVVDWEELLQFYHQELEKCLKCLDYGGRIPTLTELCVEMQLRGVYGATFGLFVASIRNAPADAGGDIGRYLSDKQEDVEFRRDLILNTEFRKQLVFLLSFCDRKGFFDV